MKRIALLGFLFFVIPIWIVSCDPCGREKPNPWIWTNIYLHVMNIVNDTPIKTGDTIQTDSVHFFFWLSFKGLASIKGNESSVYSAMACEPAPGDQKNTISKIIYGIGSLSSIETSIDTTLLLNYDRIDYEWTKNKEQFLGALSNKDAINQGSITGRFVNPDNSKPMRIVMLAIRENGDTLKAISEEIVLK